MSNRPHGTTPLIHWAALRLWRMHTVTKVFSRVRRLTVSEIGQQWGEGEWTARDLW